MAPHYSFNWIAISSRYLKSYLLESKRVAYFSYRLLLILFRLLKGLTLALRNHGQSYLKFSLLIGERLLYLVALIALISFIKSLQPRYLLFLNHSKPVDPLKRLSGKSAHAQSVPTIVKYNPQAESRCSRLIRSLRSQYSYVQGLCSRAVTQANVVSIRNQLSWSYSRHEFEQVQWLNRSVQTLWPSVKTIVTKSLADALKHPVDQLAQQQQQWRQQKQLAKPPIKAKDAASKQVKLSVYLSCRRRLDTLRKRRERVLSKGDEYLGQKVIIIIIYLIRKFLLCSKQYFVDQVRTLLAPFSPAKLSPTDAAGQLVARKEIEIDLQQILRNQQANFRAPDDLQREQVSKSAPLTGAVKRPGRVRFKSAPTAGLACNSKRILFGGLVGAASMAKCRKKRQILAQKINQAHESLAKMNANTSDKRITIDRFQLGDSAPQVTAIKFLEVDDAAASRQSKREVNRGEKSQAPVSESSDSCDMQLLIEINFSSDKNFCVGLSRVPVLDSIEITRVSMRQRLLVRVNHAAYGNEAINLRAFDRSQDGTLMPLVNYVEIVYMDVPQFNWHLRRKADPDRRSVSNRRQALTRSRLLAPNRRQPGGSRKHLPVKIKSTNSIARPPSSLIEQAMAELRDRLQPVNLINNSYFKFLVHWALGRVQKWFQPFDILIGERLRLRTLS